MQTPWPTHSVESFWKYINKVYGFRRVVEELTDGRHDPDVSPQAVFLAFFHGLLFRHTSLKQIEEELKEPGFLRLIGAKRSFRDDTLRYSLCGFDTRGLEGMLVGINQKLKRNKAFDQGRVRGRIVAALDGIEVLSSYSRCCDSCMKRQVPFKDPQGNTVHRTQYYHRGVGCQIISSPVKPFVAFQWQRAGEGEVAAAVRLLSELPNRYGSRFFDILLLDALYAQAPVLELAREKGWQVVIVLKQEARDLYQEAMALFRSRLPDQRFTERRGQSTVDVRLWHEEGIPYAPHYPVPVQIVRCKETTVRNRRRGYAAESTTTHHEWIWLTTLNLRVFSPDVVRSLGHERWKNENNGWNDLTQNWALKHGFLHACNHRPRTHPPGGRPESIPNRGLEVVVLILLIVFALFSAFSLLHSKVYRLHPCSLREVSQQLYRSLWKRPQARAPT